MGGMGEGFIDGTSVAPKAVSFCPHSGSKFRKVCKNFHTKTIFFLSAAIRSRHSGRFFRRRSIICLQTEPKMILGTFFCDSFFCWTFIKAMSEFVFLLTLLTINKCPMKCSFSLRLVLPLSLTLSLSPPLSLFLTSIAPHFSSFTS